ncbi:hypothetical protein [Cellulosimicrobium sp. RS]|uniref:hypothetical protein n=1 Tax=Cellulosimicrobium sp. RS TaxID=3381347 RepID=UPI0038FD3916
MGLTEEHFTAYQDARSLIVELVRTAPPGRALLDYGRVRLALDDLHGGTGFPPAQPVTTTDRRALVDAAVEAMRALATFDVDPLALELCVADLQDAWAQEREQLEGAR